MSNEKGKGNNIKVVRWKIIEKIEKATKGMSILSIPVIVLAIAYIFVQNEALLIPVILFGILICVLAGMRIAYENVLSEEVKSTKREQFGR